MSVLIGLVDQQIGSETLGWDVNKIGGSPVWINAESSRASPECLSCGKECTLVSQLYCPLGGSTYHRCVYVFVCPGKCSKNMKGWRVFRSMRHDEAYTETLSGTQQVPTCSEDKWIDEQDDWGEGADDWGSEEDDWGETVNNCQKSQDLTSGISQSAQQNSEASSSHQRESDVHQVVTDADSGMMQNVESFGRLKLSEDRESTSNRSSTSEDASGTPAATLSLHTEAPPVAMGGHGDGDEPQIVEEDIGLVNSDRWNAMATLLNTKHDKAVSTNTAAEHHTMFKPYYLCVVEEPASEVEDSDHVKDLIRNYERSEGKQIDALMAERTSKSKGKGGSTEAYEKTELKHGDKVFHKFLKRVQRCPQQCVRYERGGKPLLISEERGPPVLPCQYCGGERIFELQLLSPLIPYLKLCSDEAAEVDFGTVLVFTCKNNCWSAELDPSSKNDLLEEFILLQADPDHHLFR